MLILLLSIAAAVKLNALYAPDLRGQVSGESITPPISVEFQDSFGFRVLSETSFVRCIVNSAGNAVIGNVRATGLSACWSH